MPPFDEASDPPLRPASPTRRALLGYVEEMLLELAHLSAGAGETALAATLAVAAIQAGNRVSAAERSGG